MYSQLFNLLCDKADNEYGGRLPVHVRFLLDEFANIGQIPNFDKLIATIRSREISAAVILQTQSQLKTMYKDAAETITGNMDARLFLGGAEKTTLKDLSEALGKETIYMLNNSTSKGNNPSYSQNQQKLGKDLMSVDELSVMDGSKCVLQLRGVRPFLSDKFDITKHKNYRFLSDFDSKHTFDIGKFVSTKLKVNADDEYTVFDYVAADEEMPDMALDDFEPLTGSSDDLDYEDYPEDLEPV
jgi:type IV secretion system protein VirD4